MTLAIRRFEGSYAQPLVSLDYEQSSAGAPLAAIALYELTPQLPVQSSMGAQLIGEALPEVVTEPSATYIHGHHDHVKSRLRMLRFLSADRDRERAAAPNLKSIDSAIAFIDRIMIAPNYNATLDDDGSAVIEFEERAAGFFADITFRADGRVEFYRREPNQESEFFEGEFETSEALQFLESKMGLVLSP